MQLDDNNNNNRHTVTLINNVEDAAVVVLAVVVAVATSSPDLLARLMPKAAFCWRPESGCVVAITAATKATSMDYLNDELC